IETQVKNDYLSLRFPPEFDRNILDRLPESPGVYYLHNIDGSIIYIGKSNNIRKRILSHFSNKQTRKAIELRNAIRDITFETTGSELIALLLESDEIKKVQPLFNRSQRQTHFNYGIFCSPDENGYMTLKARKVSSKDQPIYTLHSHEEAREMLEKWVQKFKLCQKLCGLYDIAHACFHYSIHQCNGACIGKESADIYNQRVETALRNLRFENSNFMILGPGRSASEKSVVMVENGKYQGFGFFEPEFVAAQPDQLRDIIRFKQDNKDIHRILKYHIDHIPKSMILSYE
ncbi:MAG TPA: GIY-YIG nuclease family protein, partial [Bacteroidia bacterium]|nr:GIY-YIG nuclease family protein [Bacteroidia bacterium]